VSIKKLVETFGIEWAKDVIIPSVLEMAKVANYLKRMTMLFCINELCEVVGLEVIAEVMLPTVLWLSDDKVANVRFNVAKTLAKMELLFEAQEGHMEQLVKVRSCLKQLTEDKDNDVKYYASVPLERPGKHESSQVRAF